MSGAAEHRLMPLFTSVALVLAALFPSASAVLAADAGFAEMTVFTMDTTLNAEYVNVQTNVAGDPFSSIGITAPALMDFGAGLPGDVLTARFETTVGAYGESGHRLIAGDFEQEGVIELISVSALALRSEGDPLVILTAEGAAIELSAQIVHNTAAGTTYQVSARLTVPFVSSGTYSGPLAFSDATH